MKAEPLVALVAAALVASACSWNWTPDQDPPVTFDVDDYFDYPGDAEFALGDKTAVVRITAMDKNVLVEATPESEEWVYTPITVEVIDAGTSGAREGSKVTLAVPGGTAEGVSSPSLWIFDKAEFDAESRYVMSWTGYDYPNFELDAVAQYVYEVSENGLVRLQRQPSVTADEDLPVFAEQAVSRDLEAAGVTAAVIARTEVP